MPSHEILARRPLGVVPEPAPDVPGRVVPPPIPGVRTSHFTYFTSTPFQPLARGVLAGPRSASVPGGGALLAPDQAAGVMRVYGWWPDTRTLQLYRRDPDGVRRPVRGSAPRRVVGTTRRNLATNPSGEVGAHGYLPLEGDPTIDVLPRFDELDDATQAVAFVLDESGTGQVRVPTESAPVSDQRFTVGAEFYLPTRPDALELAQSWIDVAGNSFGTVTHTLTADEITAVVGQYTRVTVAMVVPTGAVANGPLTVRAIGAPGLQVATDRWTVEYGQTDGSYCAGSTPGGQWLGIPELSPSLNAPVQEILDAECPFDAEVVYDLYGGARAGWVRTPPARLPSPRSHYNWALSHPARPGRTLFVWVQEEPEIGNALARSTIKVQGRRNYVVFTGPERGGDSGSLIFVTDGQAELAALRREMRNGAPLLVRSPAGHGHPPVWWLSFGDTSVSALSHHAGHPIRKLTAAFDEVDPPSVIDWGAAA